MGFIKKSWILLLGLVIFACEEEENIFVSTELVPYFESFAQEAASRGIQFDWEASRIEGYINDIPETDAVGKCEFNSVDPDKVFVDIDFWRNASHLQKEFLVFHELGHCFLEREHLDAQNSDGSCASIMHSGLTDCRNLYSISTRTEYLDELFKQ